MEQKKSKASIEAEVRRHLEAEKKAYIWVERLALVDKIDEQECNTMLNSIMVAHYSDLVEERSISKVCGYPLCANPVSQKTKQKYHISLKEKKVYDAAERKCFCSDFCYKASKYIKAQIPESPIWLRGNVEEIQFLHKEDLDLPKKVNVMDEEVEKKEQKNDEESLCSKEAIVRESYKRFDQFEKQVETTKVRYSTGTPQQDGIKHSTNTKRESNKEPIQISLLEKLKTTLEDWFNDSSISKLQEDDTTEDQKLINTNAASFQQKALNFLSNNPEWVTEAEISESFKEIMKMKSEDNKDYRTVPHIHSKSQVLMRRKIVKDQIYTALEKLHSVFELGTSILTQTDFFKFVNSLRFDSRNIVLKPKEWVMATICLIHIYSRKSDELRELLQSRETELNNFILKRSETFAFDDLKTLCEGIISNRKQKRTSEGKKIKEIRITEKLSQLSTNDTNDADHNNEEPHEDEDDEEEEGTEDFFDILNASGKELEFDFEELD